MMPRAVGKAVPAHLLADAVQLPGDGVYVQRWQRVRPVARLGEGVGHGLAGHAQLRLGHVVEGRQLLVGDGPVRERAALHRPERRAQPEVHRLEPVEVAAHVHRAAAHAVGRPRGVGALVAARRALAQQVRLLPGQRHEEVAAAVENLVVDEVLGLVVRPLLQHHHLEAGAPQLQGHGRSARAAADDADVHRLLAHGCLPHVFKHFMPSWPSGGARRHRAHRVEAHQLPAHLLLVAAVGGVSEEALQRQHRQQLEEVRLAAAGRAVLEDAEQLVLLGGRGLGEPHLEHPPRAPLQRGHARDEVVAHLLQLRRLEHPVDVDGHVRVLGAGILVSREDALAGGGHQGVLGLGEGEVGRVECRGGLGLGGRGGRAALGAATAAEQHHATAEEGQPLEEGTPVHEGSSLGCSPRLGNSA